MPIPGCDEIDTDAGIDIDFDDAGKTRFQ